MIIPKHLRPEGELIWSAHQFVDCPQCEHRAKIHLEVYPNVQWWECVENGHVLVYDAAGKVLLATLFSVDESSWRYSLDRQREVDYSPQKKAWESQRRKGGLGHNEYTFYSTEAVAADDPYVRYAGHRWRIILEEELLAEDKNRLVERVELQRIELGMAEVAATLQGRKWSKNLGKKDQAAIQRAVAEMFRLRAKLMELIRERSPELEYPEESDPGGEDDA